MTTQTKTANKTPAKAQVRKDTQAITTSWGIFRGKVLVEGGFSSRDAAQAWFDAHYAQTETETATA